MVLGGRRNLLINKDCYSANETTNQAVGSSNLSGRAILLLDFIWLCHGVAD
jgi:hypothetical protein